MSYRLQGELNEALRAGLKLKSRSLCLLRAIAEHAHHEQDEAHKDGKPRQAGREEVAPRHAWITNAELLALMGNMSNTNRKHALADLEALGLTVRVARRLDRDGNPVYGTGGPSSSRGVGESPLYRLPTVPEFQHAIEYQRRKEHGHELD